MGQTKPHKGLLDKKGFKLLEREKKLWLKDLSMQRAISLEESLLSSSLIWQWRKNFSLDNPVCLKLLLNKKCRKKEKI